MVAAGGPCDTCDVSAGLLGRALGEVLFPPVCAVCRVRGEGPLCASCLRRFTLITPPFCAKCGRPAQGPTTVSACMYRCQAMRFTRARAAGIYEGALREAIHALKFGGCRALAEPLGDAVAAAHRAIVPRRTDVVVPVPLHPSRYRQRGFNQAALLGRRVARAFDLPCDHRLLRRVHATDAQSRLTRELRETNVRGAFVCDRPVAGLRVLLIDDVMSTGFTVSECAGALRAAGATEVTVATVAAAVLL